MLKYSSNANNNSRIAKIFDSLTLLLNYDMKII
ncbi:hypothetical protein CLV82_1610 [Zeaxanthinibacter enoshimensis]|uniref:Uncharacterized protein n=1 Tax=Zeaxanthinibacter enoshimensis TaxID=392009 RepID=A0A4V3D3Q8_9FLAO|nr:hypothetical protein CLV82_1610 [Zeaxanthinibacter enoshimensis]